ncbi:uncharacterized protein MCYG_01366 [Microsporum canis CBS 113480]|uniref:Uncharacterized protein n=1 Tax=Arthroderma otae (strain ATCC MYA-4605 / CBS 113480) TaxID=554155 RepID=C5FF94_ARTOC|nr:uncharacterized protein MCYG_01366 [Microsporum canis CBS 113480]EEQ28478.1 predicted protein [Microsporum canis CBS 113480]
MSVPAPRKADAAIDPILRSAREDRSEKFDVRYRKFNPNALLNAAVRSISNEKGSLDYPILDVFAVDPLTDERHWEGNIGTACITALGSNEILWTETYARPRMNYHWSMEHPEVPVKTLKMAKKGGEEFFPD